jgi:hypothetical protein
MKPTWSGPPLMSESSSEARGCVCGTFTPHGTISNLTTVMPSDLQIHINIPTEQAPISTNSHSGIDTQ